MDFIFNEAQQIDIQSAPATHAHDLIHFCKGWHKFSPFIGACLSDYLHDKNEEIPLLQVIQDELRNDQIPFHTITQTEEMIDLFLQD